LSSESKTKRLTKAINEAYRAAWALVRDWEPNVDDMPAGLTEDQQIQMVVRSKSAECVTKVAGIGLIHGQCVPIPGFVFDEQIVAAAMHNVIVSCFDALAAARAAGAITLEEEAAVCELYRAAIIRALPAQSGDLS
jgi:hypothetical protein